MNAMYRFRRIVFIRKLLISRKCVSAVTVKFQFILYDSTHSCHIYFKFTISCYDAVWTILNLSLSNIIGANLPQKRMIFQSVIFELNFSSKFWNARKNLNFIHLKWWWHSVTFGDSGNKKYLTSLKTVEF